MAALRRGFRGLPCRFSYGRVGMRKNYEWIIRGCQEHYMV